MGGAGFTLGQLAATLKGTVDGDAARVGIGVASLETAGPQHIAFVADGRYRLAALSSRAGAFLAADDVQGLPAPVIRCREPRLTLIELLHLFHPPASPNAGIDASARVAPDARVHPTATVSALAVVEAGAVIGAHAPIDRGTLGPTIVRRGVKIDNLVMVAHNVEIGEDTVIAAQTGISGSCKIGRGVVLGGQVGIGDHVSIGDGAMLSSQTGVISDVAAGLKLGCAY